MNHLGFFNFEDRLASLSKADDSLEVLLQTVDFKIFRKTLDPPKISAKVPARPMIRF